MRIALFGTGNLATHFLKAFEELEAISCVQWIGRKENPPLANNTPYFNAFQNDIEVDICILAISDDYISEVAQSFKTNSLVVHTAAAQSMDVLIPHKRKACFCNFIQYRANVAIPDSIGFNHRKRLICFHKQFCANLMKFI